MPLPRKDANVGIAFPITSLRSEKALTWIGLPRMITAYETKRRDLFPLRTHHPYTLIDKDKENEIPKNIGQSVLLYDLKPATTYYLVMVVGKYQSREFHFVTAPDDDRPVQLLFGGDSRRGPKWPEVHEDRPSVNRFLAGLLEEHPDIIALAHGAD